MHKWMTHLKRDLQIDLNRLCKYHFIFVLWWMILRQFTKAVELICITGLMNILWLRLKRRVIIIFGRNFGIRCLDSLVTGRSGVKSSARTIVLVYTLLVVKACVHNVHVYCWRVPTPTCWSYLLGTIPSHQRILQSCWRVPVPSSGTSPPPGWCSWPCSSQPSTLLWLMWWRQESWTPTPS